MKESEIFSSEALFFLERRGAVLLEGWTSQLDKLLAGTGIISNFTCGPQLLAFGVKNDVLISLPWEGEKRMLLVRQREIEGLPITDVRILFHRRPEDGPLISQIVGYLRPFYVAYNLIPQEELPKIPSSFPFFPIRNELIINVNHVAKCGDHELERAYRRALKRNGPLELVLAQRGDLARINGFLDEWCLEVEQRGQLGPGKQTAANDRRLLDMFLGAEGTWCWLAFLGEKMVGLSFYTYHPSSPKRLAVKIILKNLREIEGQVLVKMGQQLMIEEARKILEQGYKWAVMGGNENPTQAYFKEEFMGKGRRKKYYSCEVFCEPALSQIIGDSSRRADYLRAIWA